jgi:hypothetical protein
MTEPTTPASADTRARDTYRYLRVIAMLPAVWILLAIVAAWIAEHHLRTSISAYYGSPVRDIFVGGLMACGICLIAYKGKTRVEDYVLNFAGFNLFFVALVPNTFGDLVKARSGDARSDMLTFLAISLTTFLVIAFVFILVDKSLFEWVKFDWKGQDWLATVFIVATIAFELFVLSVVIAATAMAYAGAQSTGIYIVVHFGAATTMIANLVFAAASHAFPGKLRADKEAAVVREPARLEKWFKFITLYMLIGIPAALIASWSFDWSHWIIAIEIWEIFGFLVYWVLATHEEWTRDGGRVAAYVRAVMRGLETAGS